MEGGTADLIRRLKRSRCYRIQILKSHCPTFQKKWCRQKRKANVLHSQRHSVGTEEVARLNEELGSRNSDYSSSRGIHKLACLTSINNLLNQIVIILTHQNATIWPEDAMTILQKLRICPSNSHPADGFPVWEGGMRIVDL